MFHITFRSLVPISYISAVYKNFACSFILGDTVSRIHYSCMSVTKKIIIRNNKDTHYKIGSHYKASELIPCIFCTNKSYL